MDFGFWIADWSYFKTSFYNKFCLKAGLRTFKSYANCRANKFQLILQSAFYFGKWLNLSINHLLFTINYLSFRVPPIEKPIVNERPAPGAGWKSWKFVSLVKFSTPKVKTTGIVSPNLTPPRIECFLIPL